MSGRDSESRWVPFKKPKAPESQSPFALPSEDSGRFVFYSSLDEVSRLVSIKSVDRLGIYLTLLALNAHLPAKSPPFDSLHPLICSLGSQRTSPLTQLAWLSTAVSREGTHSIPALNYIATYTLDSLRIPHSPIVLAIIFTSHGDGWAVLEPESPHNPTGSTSTSRGEPPANAEPVNPPPRRSCIFKRSLGRVMFGDCSPVGVPFGSMTLPERRGLVWC
ncbi:hypothetical protein C8R44DRAFT_879969 [Mycena epipterygia]|nr:hypothetical protein C8R44DRAFT_879969 [Mycena epipterygia]